MHKFYDKVWKNYRSQSPVKRSRDEVATDHARSFTKKITVATKDQNLAFWEFDQYFGENDEIFNLDEVQKQQYIKRFGEEALVQGYLRAKVK